MSTDHQAKQQVPSAETLLTAKDVAERLNVSESWVYAEVQAKRLPAGRFGRHCRFRAEDLENYIAAGFDDAPVAHVATTHAVRADTDRG